MDDTIFYERWDIQHRPLKRLFDIGFSALAIIVCTPLFLITCVLIRLNSPGKAIYKQNRVGRGGVLFECYKFRTMYVDADERLDELLATNPLKHQEWMETRKLRKDPRVTPIGRFLRVTSLDEFPQFWNVFKGDLSVVGPRPVVYEEMVKYFGYKAQKVFSVRPGITGLWQISGRSDTGYEQRVVLDEKYVDKQCLLLDLKIIVKTIPSILSRKGAY